MGDMPKQKTRIITAGTSAKQASGKHFWEKAFKPPSQLLKPNKNFTPNITSMITKQMLSLAIVVLLPMSTVTGLWAATSKRAKSKNDDKPTPTAPQLAKKQSKSKKSKKKQHCSKDSKKVTKWGITRKFTAETCDPWNYVKTYFNNHETVNYPPIPQGGGFNGVLTNREVDLGIPLCRSWAVYGPSTGAYYVVLFSDTVTKTGEIKIKAVHTGVELVDGAVMDMNQLNNCDWKTTFIDQKSGESLSILVTGEGEVRPFNVDEE